MFATFDPCSIQKCCFEIHDQGINTFLLDQSEANLVVGCSQMVCLSLLLVLRKTQLVMGE